MTSDTDIHQQVLALLDGPGDRWDRPECDWPGRSLQGDRTDDEVALARQSANTAYVMGSLNLERGNLDRARTWFTMACDERHPGAAFRLAVLGMRQTADLAAAAREQAVAGVLAALCRSAEWGHADAHRLIAPFITRTSTGTAVLAFDNADTGIVTSLPVSDTSPGAPYEPQDPTYYDEVLAFCEGLPAAAQAATASETGQSSRALRLPLAVPAGSLTKLTKWASRDLPLETPQHEFWTGVACHLLRLHSVPDARLTAATAHHAVLRELRQAHLEPLKPWPGRARAPWMCRCVRCGAVTSLDLPHALVGRACHQCAGARGQDTDLATLRTMCWETAEDVAQASADRWLATWRTVRSQWRAPGSAPALTEISGFTVHRPPLANVAAAPASETRHRRLAEHALRTFLFLDTDWWDRALEHNPETPESPTDDHLPSTQLVAATSSGERQLGPAWAELLQVGTPLPAVPPRTAHPAFHMVRDEDTLYLFTTPHPSTEAEPHSQLLTPTALTAMSPDLELPDPAHEHGDPHRTITPNPPVTAHPLQVFALC